MAVFNRTLGLPDSVEHQLPQVSPQLNKYDHFHELIMVIIDSWK